MKKPDRPQNNNIKSSGTPISFGESSNIGDVQIKYAAGRDINLFINKEDKITIHRSEMQIVRFLNIKATTKGFFLTSIMLSGFFALGLARTWSGWSKVFETYFLYPSRVYPWVLGLAISMVLVKFSLLLHRRRYLRLGWLNLEAGTQNGIYMTKINGICPRCQSKLELVYIGKDEEKILKLKCHDNPSNHQWDFAPAMLPSIDE